MASVVLGDLTGYVYILGPRDLVSAPHHEKEAAREACEKHVRELLAKAGLEDA